MVLKPASTPSLVRSVAIHSNGTIHSCDSTVTFTEMSTCVSIEEKPLLRCQAVVHQYEELITNVQPMSISTALLVWYAIEKLKRFAIQNNLLLELPKLDQAQLIDEEH